MTDRRRVWITGLGIITACGTGLDAFRAGLRAARSPVKRIDRFDPSPFRSQVAAQVDDFDPLAWMPPKTARQLDRFSQFGLVAGRLALDDAGLTPGARGAADPERIGIYLGSALGGIAYAEEQHERYLERGIRQSRRTWRWPCSAGRRRPTSASPSTSAGRSCRPPTRARRVRSRSARRSGTCARAGSMRRSPAAARSR